jgi:hypothetical protein
MLQITVFVPWGVAISFTGVFAGKRCKCRRQTSFVFLHGNFLFDKLLVSHYHTTIYARLQAPSGRASASVAFASH